tara:strand:+ start:7603 stop:7788 length:186 start_codon:yes stop_codon:yes gene_type:complete
LISNHNTYAEFGDLPKGLSKKICLFLVNFLLFDDCLDSMEHSFEPMQFVLNKFNPPRFGFW